MSRGDLFDLSGKTVVVTGGLGMLGREFVKELARRGARPVIFDLLYSPEASRKAFDGQEMPGFAVDLASRPSIDSAVAELIARFGVPEALVNNAALDSPPNAPLSENGPFETYPESSWEKVMDVNVTGLFRLCQALGSKMAEAGRGSIVNISSIYGLLSPDQSLYEYRRQRGEEFYKPVAYSVSKSAILNLTRYLATYWAKQGVRVNTLTLAGVANGQAEEFLEAYCKKIPIGRMADRTEYNGALVFLCSDASRYMTGSNLVVDGGWTAW